MSINFLETELTALDGVEGDENPQDAFVREVLEETGCKVKIVDELETIGKSS